MTALTDKMALAWLRSDHEGTTSTISQAIRRSFNGTSHALRRLSSQGLIVAAGTEQREGNGVRGTIWAAAAWDKPMHAEAVDLPPGLPIVASALLSRPLLATVWSVRP